MQKGLFVCNSFSLKVYFFRRIIIGICIIKNTTYCVNGSPMGNRTPVSAVRGRRLNRLTMRPCQLLNNIMTLDEMQMIFMYFLK